MVPSFVFEIDNRLVEQAIILRNRHLPVTRLVFFLFSIILISFSIISLLQIMQVIGDIVKMDIQGRPDLPEEDAIFLQIFDVGEQFIRGIIERRGLKSIGLHGEGADADEALKLPSTIARLAKLREIIAQYPKSQVYNEDETGLYYRCLPKRSYLLGTEDARIQVYEGQITADGVHVHQC
jgi:hypothetical protein